MENRNLHQTVICKRPKTHLMGFLCVCRHDFKDFWGEANIVVLAILTRSISLWMRISGACKHMSINELPLKVVNGMSIFQLNGKNLHWIPCISFPTHTHTYTINELVYIAQLASSCGENLTKMCFLLVPIEAMRKVKMLCLILKSLLFMHRKPFQPISKWSFAFSHSDAQRR